MDCVNYTQRWLKKMYSTAGKKSRARRVHENKPQCQLDEKRNFFPMVVHRSCEYWGGTTPKVMAAKWQATRTFGVSGRDRETAPSNGKNGKQNLGKTKNQTAKSRTNVMKKEWPPPPKIWFVGLNVCYIFFVFLLFSFLGSWYKRRSVQQLVKS